jgi:L-ribulose-5-phosphate 4-epimerase
MIAKELREQAYEANLALPRYGLVLFTWGNASAIDHREGLLAIKPSGVEYDELRPEHMVVLDFSGRVVEGEMRPSSDTPTHLELAHELKVGGVVHTHSRHATMWAQAGLDLPCYGTTQADYFRGAVPCTRHLRDDEVTEHYEHHTGTVIVETLKSRGLDPGDVPGALVRNHAPFTWRADAAAAVYHARVLEEVARLALGTRLLNAESAPLSEVVLEKHHQRKHGPDAYYGQDKFG